MQFRAKDRSWSPKTFPRQQFSTIPEARRPTALQMPTRIEIAQATPCDVVATPVPNLLHSLGHTAVATATATSPTPPLTPVTPGDEELFYSVRGAEGVPLGSPSDPSFQPRKATVPKRAPVRPKATPFARAVMDSGGSERTADGYFSIPTAEQRPGRRRSSASGSSHSEEEEWTIEKTDFGNGGLKNAVEAASDPSEKVYVGTLGFGTDGLDESAKVVIEGRLREDHECLVAYTSDADFDGHYNHYCKEVRLLADETTG